MATSGALPRLIILVALLAAAARAQLPLPAGETAVRAIEGRVRGPSGPLEGAQVTARFSESTAEDQAATNLDPGRELAKVVALTAADGRYRIEVPAELVGDPRVRVTISPKHQGHFGRTLGPLPVADISGRTIEPDEPFWSHRRMERAAIANTQLRASRPFSARVLPAAGAPAAGATISMRTKYQAYGWKFQSADDYQVMKSAQADEQGNFTIPRDSQASLVITLPDHAPLAIADLDKYPPAREAEPVLRLPLGVRARGRVLSVGGRPIAGAIVVARSETVWNEFDMPVGITRTAAADRSGDFQLPPLPAGKYRFAVSQRVADAARIDDFKRDANVPTEPLADEILDQVHELAPDAAPAPLELCGVETVAVSCRIEYPDGPPAEQRPVDLAVSGKVDGQRWSGKSAKAGPDGVARLNVPRGAQDVLI
jgi:hypothetical protein